METRVKTGLLTGTWYTLKNDTRTPISTAVVFVESIWAQLILWVTPLFEVLGTFN